MSVYSHVNYASVSVHTMYTNTSMVHLCTTMYYIITDYNNHKLLFYKWFNPTVFKRLFDYVSVVEDVVHDLVLLI